MTELDKHQEKKWASSFVVDGAKLMRLHDLAKERLAKSGREVTFEFVTNTSRNRLSKTSNPDDVLKLDNTRKDPIRSLSMKMTGTRHGSTDLRATVEFSPRSSSPSQNQNQNIVLAVAGTDHNLVNDVFSVIYEQIERALVAPWSQLGALAALATIFAFMLLMLLSAAGGSHYGAPRFSNEDLTELDLLAASAHNTESQIAFLFEAQRRELSALTHKDSLGFGGISKLTLGTTMVIIVVSAALLCYMAAVCYPSAVFAWGDYGEYYATLVARRKAIWKFLGVSVAGGILINLFSTSIQQHSGH